MRYWILATVAACCVLCPILLSIANRIHRKETANLQLLKNWRSVETLPLPSPLPPWGSYHPGIYHGLRTATSPSFLAANIFWFSEHDRNIRYQTERDESLYFEYRRHNGLNFGIQDIVDDRHRVKLETSFVTSPESNSAAWMQRIVVSKTSTEQDTVSLYFSFGIECDGAMDTNECIREMTSSEITLESRSVKGYSESYVVSGNNAMSKKFVMEINVQSNSSKPLVSYNGHTQLTVYDNVHAFQSFIRRLSADQEIQLDNDLPQDSTSLLFAFNSNEDFVLDVVFHEDVGSKHSLHYETSATDVSEAISLKLAEFEKRFAENFHFLNTTYTFLERDIEAAKRVLSSSLGGIGYFHGSPRLGDAPDREELPETVNPHIRKTSLYTATPSRTAFPRGFLWDEGFHQLLIFRWNPMISAQILTSWMNAMLTSASKDHSVLGWLPREMILGKDAEKRVPDEFITQRVTVANPPTLLMVAARLAKLVAPFCDSSVPEGSEGTDNNRILLALRSIYPRLHAWIQGLLVSQQDIAGDGRISFRWRGRSSRDRKFIPNTLASGLDDYPRSILPSSEESHLDLLCWMIWAARVMAELQADLFPRGGKDGDHTFDYSALATNLSDRIFSLHWSANLSGFYDLGAHSEIMKQVTEIGVRCATNIENPASQENFAIPLEIYQGSDERGCPPSHPVFVAMLVDSTTGNELIRTRVVPVDLHVQHVPRVGYVNIFPLLLKHLDPEASALSSVLDMLEDPEQMWSSHGLRSLSAKDVYYKRNNAPHDSPYWR